MPGGKTRTALLASTVGSAGDTVLAAVRKEADIAVANVFGSNIFNGLFILGASAGVRPLGVDLTLMRFEIPGRASLRLVPFAATSATIKRWEGVVLLVSYVGITVVTVIHAVG